MRSFDRLRLPQDDGVVAGFTNAERLWKQVQERGRDVLDQPDAVVRDVEDVPLLVHLAGRHGEYGWPAVAGPDPARRVNIRRQMDVVAGHLKQAGLPDRANRLVAGP